MLDSNSLTYTDYKDPRSKSIADFEEGFSGRMLLGTDKKTGKKYLIKHTYPHNAANEYICYTIANMIGVAVPRAFLLSPNEKFASKYAVAIECLEGMKEVSRDNLTRQMKTDICRGYAFQYAFAQSDLVSIREWKDRVVTFDFSETLNMDGMQYVLALLEKKSDDAVELLNRYYHAFKNSMATDLDYANVFERNFGIEPDFTFDVMDDLKKRLSEILDSEIDEICNELELMYPMEISLYYELAIQAVRDCWRNIGD